MKNESSAPETKSIPVSCNKDCAAGCPLLAHVEDGKIIKITDNPKGTPYMHGCSKGFQAMQMAYAPERLLKPLIRTGPRGSGKFKEVSWDEALDYVAAGLRKIKGNFGSESILFLGGSGSCRGALHNTGSLTQRFLNMFGGYMQTYGNYSCAASDFVTPYVFGTLKVGIDAATLQHSKLIILWGANILDTRFGSENPTRIREAGKNGVPIIVIDPRKTRTAHLPNAEWFQIRPGTDTAMMASVLHELLKNNQLEREDILFPGMNYLFYSGKAMEPPGNAKNDYDIFCELSDRLGFPDIYSEGKTAAEWIEQFLAESVITDYEHFKQTGIFSGEKQTRIGLSDFIADPAKNPLETPSGKIELASENYAETGFPAVPTYRGMADEEEYPLRLVTPHSLHRINSSYSNVQWFRDREPHALWMNPADAKKRDIREDRKVIVKSPRGKMKISVMITEDIMPGVVCLLQGIWPSLDEKGMDQAGATNILTSTEPTEPSMGSRTHSVMVEVELYKAQLGQAGCSEA